jgi:hypothetical protein
LTPLKHLQSELKSDEPIQVGEVIMSADEKEFNFPPEPVYSPEDEKLRHQAFLDSRRHMMWMCAQMIAQWDARPLTIEQRRNLMEFYGIQIPNEHKNPTYDEHAYVHEGHASDRETIKANHLWPSKVSNEPLRPSVPKNYNTCLDSVEGVSPI